MSEHELLEEMRRGRPVLPLTRGQAAAQAYRLRVKHGLPYTVIARIMGEYHGIWLGERAWRQMCRQLGAPPLERPNNVAPPGRRQVQQGEALAA